MFDDYDPNNMVPSNEDCKDKGSEDCVKCFYFNRCEHKHLNPSGAVLVMLLGGGVLFWVMVRFLWLWIQG